MTAVPIHLVRLLCACAAWVVLSGCTTFAYRHADWFLSWKIDQYVDLNREQWYFVRGRLKDLLLHHRHEALPVYEHVLMEVKRRAMDGLTREELNWIFERYQQLRADLVERALPDGVVLLTSVNDAQVRHLDQMLQKDMEKAKRRVNEAPETREAKRIASAMGLLKDWLGSLSWEQEYRIRDLIRSLPDTDRHRVAYFEDRQRELLQLLSGQRDSQLLRDRLREWFLFPERVAPDYAGAVNEQRQDLKGLALAIDEVITPRQRAHALGRLQSLIDDVHALTTS